MKRYEKYIECGNLKDATHLEISVYYSKGGLSYLTGESSPRGYYISVTPVTKSNGMVRFTMFTGRRRLLLETKRYSDKQFARAVEMGKEIEPELTAAVMKEQQAA